MDVLAFTDIHGDTDEVDRLRRRAHHADIAICAGDITSFGDDIEALIESLAAFPCEVYLIHGNHESPQVLQNLSLITDGVTYLHKQVLDLDDHHLIGYGGEGFSFTTEDFEEFVKNTPIPTQNIILVTHQPPHNTSLDKLGSRHTGNNSFRKFIDAHPVILAVSGHMHENFDKTDTVSDTRCINPGPDGMLLTL